MADQPLRTPLGQAIGLGSAKEGVQHWWAQRVSAVALIVLGLWFVVSVIAHAGADRATVVAWLHGPLSAILMILTLAAVFYHAALGMQVVIEDYVHSEWVKVSSLVAMRLICLALAVAGIFAVLRIAFGG
ncbi:MAG TPA: succinate dehydrogenase, hydrophobic membrane anchor protein [Stellaceae bacterium]|jgi:succinate dehydrogenase / fumarate reductase membrane anchor subunit|nr:succinate dehydrogenase, hydrophobic membrane anchor protein [Stellaceae bacterium]